MWNILSHMVMMVFTWFWCNPQNLIQMPIDIAEAPMVVGWIPSLKYFGVDCKFSWDRKPTDLSWCRVATLSALNISRFGFRSRFRTGTTLLMTSLHLGWLTAMCCTALTKSTLASSGVLPLISFKPVMYGSKWHQDQQ